MAEPSETVADEALAPGTVIDDAYRIDGVLGRGGMGVVHRAFNLKLERPVALKVHFGRGIAFERLAREATALARLSHPNVVAVHRVGTHDGKVYVAMELVEGGTARQHLATTRPWREIVRLYAAAGDGLAAAHAAGLVHRDFKPDNVLVGSDGRPRVADFGLARAFGELPGVTGAPVGVDSGATAAVTPATVVGGSAPSEAVAGGGDYLAHAAASRRTPRLDATLTATGAWVGTPAYMAPEQIDGGLIDARTDQFSFAVALWEALHGARPFRGHTTTELRKAIAAGELQPGPRPIAPRWVDDVLRRALREKPADRWPALPAMLTALRHDPAVRRRRIALGAGALGLAGAAAVVAWQVRGGGPTRPRCDGGAAAIAPAWGPTQADGLRRALVATGHPYAPTIADQIVHDLGDYATAWAAAQDTGCRARADRTWSAELADRSVACLARRRTALIEVADVLATIDAEQVESARDATATLGPVGECVDASWLDGYPVMPTDPAAVRAFEEAAQSLARLSAMRSVRDYDAALPVADQALVKARASGNPRMIAEALVERGRIAVVRDEPEASKYLDDGFFTARTNRAGDVAAEAAVLRVRAALDRNDVATATEWMRHADAEVAAGGLAGSFAIDLPYARAMLLERQGQLTEAIAALAEARRSYDPARARSMGGAQLLDLEANLVAATGDYAHAIELGERAMVAFEAWLGDGHPQLSLPLSNLGLSLSSAGRHREAIATHTRAIAVCRPSPACQTRLPLFQLNLGSAQVNAHLDEEALATLAEAERGLAPRGAEADADLGLVASARGLALDHLDRFADSEAAYRAALVHSERALGPDHPEVAAILNNLGNVIVAQDRYADAVPVLTRAVAIWEASAPGAPEAGLPLTALGRAQLGLGKATEALATLRTAVARLDDGGSDADNRGAARLRLSQALWATGARAEARAEAGAALHTQGLGGDLVAEIQQWQRTMDPP